MKKVQVENYLDFFFYFLKIKKLTIDLWYNMISFYDESIRGIL